MPAAAMARFGLAAGALPWPVIVIPTCKVPLAVPAKAVEDISTQRTTTELHIGTGSWLARPIVRFRDDGVPRWDGYGIPGTPDPGSAWRQQEGDQPMVRMEERCAGFRSYRLPDTQNA